MLVQRRTAKGLGQLKKSNLLLKLSFRSDPKLLCVVRATVGEMAASLGFSHEEVRSMVLAVDEALANVIRHAYLGRLDQPVQIFLSRGEVVSSEGVRDALEIHVIDQGTPLELERLQGRQLDDIRPGGLGLHFIREIMDSVTFRHVKGRNHLRLIKFLTPAKPSGKPQES
jgi:anti-sigma regulatory factor (Ser/Thr protein kinase)